MITDQDLIPGMQLKVRQATNTISRVTYDVLVDIVWIENGHVHYRKNGAACVEQTPIPRFLDIVNNPPRAWQ